MPRSLIATLLMVLFGCDHETDFGPVCEARGMRVDEIYAANEFDPYPPGQDIGCGWPDWIELYNGHDEPVDLTDWTLTPNILVPGPTLGETSPDGPLRLDPGERVVVLALPYVPSDGECDPADSDHPPWLFLGMDLDRDNGRVTLKSPNGGVCDDIFYPDQHVDWSWSRLPERGDIDRCAMTEPTPGSENNGAITQMRYPCSW